MKWLKAAIASLIFCFPFLPASCQVSSAADNSSSPPTYRTITRTYDNASYYTKGLLVKETLADGQGRKYTQTVHTYETVTVQENSVFPQLTRTTKFFYEGDQGEKSTYTAYKYDNLGNVTEFTDGGEPLTTADDVVAAIRYWADPTMGSYIVGKPDKISVMASGIEMRRREAAFEPATGNLLQVREYLADGTFAQTDLTYKKPYGTLLSVTSPANLKGQRYAVTYGYDTETESYVTGISDSFGLSSTAVYNYKYGKVEFSTDSNLNVMTTAYDGFGRIASITGPYEQGSNLATLQFQYHPEATVPYALTRHLDPYRSPTGADRIETVLFTDGLKRVLQTKKDDTFYTSKTGAPADGMTVSGRVTFDGLGRIKEQRYPVTEGLGNQGTFNAAIDAVLPTKMEYDVLDRNVKTTLPDGTQTSMTYGFGADRNGQLQFATTVTDSNGKSKTSFRDVNELITAVQELNAGTTIWTSYQYDPLKQIVRVQDDKNNLTLITYDNLGRRTSIDNPDTGRTETLYDLAGNVTAKITANLRATGQQISYDYDFGRLIAIRYPNHPENNVTYTYGAPVSGLQSPVYANGAGRIVKVTDGSGTEERFYGRLGEIVKEIKTVPVLPLDEEENRRKGESEKRGGDSEHETRNPKLETYTTEYTYDSFGRIQKLIYPDGEVLTYKYNSGGLLEGATGTYGIQTFNYIGRLEYDKFEQRALLQVGNGALTTYAYDPNNRRLANLNTVTTYVPEIEYDEEHGPVPPAPAPVTVNFQNLKYTYDNVGNILALKNEIPVPAPQYIGRYEHHPMTGPTEQKFVYDDLYRLTQATGTYQPKVNRIDRYSLSMSYDTIHNITRKNQLHEVLKPEEGHEHTLAFHPEHKSTYDWTYQYQTPHPHAPSYIGDNLALVSHEEEHLPQGRNFTYDANGNQTGWTKVGEEESEKRRSGESEKGRSKEKEKSDDYTRTIVWDEENRILSISDHGKTQRYVYNDRGERVIKVGGGDRTVYVNQYYTISDGTKSKHVFAGTTRIATRTQHGEGEATGFSKHEKVEAHVFYYHPDHLGSTGFVTDENGRLYEHMEYFPFGETWVDEDGNGSKLPYLFTSKELDEETGLYYYGARYYDPRTSVWQSPDPILGRYLNGNPSGGIHTPQNLALYGYAHNNPVNYTDPDGRWVKFAVMAWKMAVKGESIASEVQGLTENAQTVMDPKASLMDKMMAVADTALDVTTGFRVKDVKEGMALAEKVSKGGVEQVNKGKAGVELSKKAAVERGEKIVGEEITVKTSAGNRKVDLLTETKEGELKGVESKVNTSPYLKSQEKKDSLIETEGGIAVGKNAENAGVAGDVKFKTIVERHNL